MEDPDDVADTLRVVLGHLRLARKCIQDAGRLEALREIDTFINVIMIETERQIAILDPTA